MYRVLRDGVTAKCATEQGVRVMGFMAGGFLPDTVDEAALTHLLELGLVEEVTTSEPDLEPEPEPDPDPEPEPVKVSAKK